MKTEIIETPFRDDDDDQIRMVIQGDVVWFETDYAQKNEITEEILLWAADFIKDYKP